MRTEDGTGLLLSDHPIKIVALNNGDIPANDHAPQTVRQHGSMLVSAISMKKAFVMQTGAADHKALFNGLIEGFRNEGPALFLLHVPDRSAHTKTWSNWYDLAKLAIVTRSQFQARYKADNTTQFLSNDIDISMNPDYGNPWMNLAIHYKEKDELIEANYTPTWADFAFALSAWQGQFKLCKDTENTVDVAAYLKLSVVDRVKKTAVINVVSDEELTQYFVSDLVINTTEAVAENWQTLQEIAGTLIPYPQKLRAEIEKELKAVYEQELALAKAELNKELKEKEQQQVEVIRQRLKDKLIMLAKQGSAKA